MGYESLILRTNFSLEEFCPSRLYIVVVRTNRDVKLHVERLLKRHGDISEDTIEACGYAVCIPQEVRKYYIFLSLESLTYNTIAHEAYHCTEYITASLTEIDIEKPACIQGYIVDRIIYSLLKNKIEISNDKY